jgi:NAD(P)-dependent dehydrogenase (short-subunit alcohol dehydrogenase family)
VSNKKIWFITGAGRGMGADFAKAALAAGHSVVATGRNSDAVSKTLGQSNDLLAVKLDVTKRVDAEAAVRAAVDRFGRIDVLLNNAASFYAGYFEELTPEQFERQLSVSLIGPMNVTRAVLPVMRKQRAGHIISISSSAGLAAGFEFVTAYAASKFGLEGWMESLHAEVAPFGITTTIVNPGFFRTELLRSSPRTTRNRLSRTTTSVEGRWSSTGNPRTGGNPATPRGSRGRSSRLPVGSRRRAASSPAPMPLPPLSRRSLI